MILSKLPLILHILVETAAARSFILQPHSQLPLQHTQDGGAARREADLLLGNLGGALLATNLVALALALRPDAEAFDRTGRLVTLALASYHFWPARRAWSRIAGPVAPAPRGEAGAGAPLGGPPVHLAVHSLCLVAMLLSGLFGRPA